MTRIRHCLVLSALFFSAILVVRLLQPGSGSDPARPGPASGNAAKDYSGAADYLRSQVIDMAPDHDPDGDILPTVLP